MKKHKGYKPQVRRKTKETTGEFVSTDLIFIAKERIPDEDNPGYMKDNVYGSCTCGWRTDKDVGTFKKIGDAAKNHANETGHKLRSHEE